MSCGESTWTTKNGVTIPLHDMTDDHLLNAERMVSTASEAAWSFASMVSGEMASYYAEQDCNRTDQQWEELLLEIHRRNLTPRE